MPVFIGKLNAVNFIFNTSEFSGGAVPGIGIIGAVCLELDTGYYWIVKSDLTLQRYYLPSGETIDIGDVQLLAGTALIGSTFSPMVSAVSAYSGQITVIVPGTSVQYGDVALINGVYVKALAANTGKMYIGYATGDNRAMFELSAGETILVQVSNLSQVWIDASVAGEKVCWLKA